jgi:hypothetical protein
MTLMVNDCKGSDRAGHLRSVEQPVPLRSLPAARKEAHRVVAARIFQIPQIFVQSDQRQAFPRRLAAFSANLPSRSTFQRPSLGRA